MTIQSMPPFESKNDENLVGLKLPNDRASASVGMLRTPIEERYFASAAIKTLQGVPQLPYDEISREEALKRPAYFVGRFVAGVLIEAEKFDAQGKSQYVINYIYKGIKPSESSIE